MKKVNKPLSPRSGISRRRRVANGAAIKLLDVNGPPRPRVTASLWKARRASASPCGRLIFLLPLGVAASRIRAVEVVTG
jgi:hypothetical protein